MKMFIRDSCMLDEGTVCAIPAYGTTQVMYYNRELFERAEIDPNRIGTWQDLERAAEAISGMGGGEGKRYGWEPMWGADNLIDIALSNGGSPVSYTHLDVYKRQKKPWNSMDERNCRETAAVNERRRDYEAKTFVA